MRFWSGMAITINPDRKQRFTEAYSDALAVLIPQHPDVVFGLEAIPDLVKIKLNRISKGPTKFDIDIKVMEMTCADLGIELTRDSVVKFLEGGEAVKVAPTKEEIETAIGAKLTELCNDPQALHSEAICAILAGMFPSYSFSCVQDEFVIEEKAAA